MADQSPDIQPTPPGGNGWNPIPHRTLSPDAPLVVGGANSFEELEDEPGWRDRPLSPEPGVTPQYPDRKMGAWADPVSPPPGAIASPPSGSPQPNQAETARELVDTAEEALATATGQALPTSTAVEVPPAGGSAVGTPPEEFGLVPAGPDLPAPPAPPFGLFGGPPSGEEAHMRAMSYREHLEELRDRLIKSVIALVVCVAISFLFTETVFTVLKSRAEGVTLIRTGVAEMIGTYVKVAFISGIILSTPVWLYQVIMFVAPGLTKQEKRFLWIALPFVLTSFALGVLFAFFILLPPALTFLIHFGEDIAQPLIRVGDYVSVVTSLLLWIGLIFELPIVMYVLARVGVVTPTTLRAKRRYAIVGAFVASAVVTPTVDPVNQSIVAIPIILLYEVGILLSLLAVKARGGSKT
ncbi:MAG: twin-arginine translocase subunit TatC [Chloroflexota bacterium]